MDSFVFNNFKKRFLKGEVPPEDTWKFTYVNSKFEKYKNVNSYKDQNDFITVSGTEAFENACTDVKPIDVCYSALESVDVNYSSMKPMFITTKNWEEFEKQYHVYIVNTDANGVETPRLYCGQDLYTLFFSIDEAGNKIGLFGKFDGFYWIRTKEELAWVADHVNGEYNGNRIGSYNNKIAIVLGDDIGVEDINPLDSRDTTVKISSCIGKYSDRMFEGLFFGNGFGIKNINLICNNDTNGIIGYLGQGGMIRNVLISGKNYVTCENKITINHIKNKATDVVAGILCGCNYGSIVDVMAVGSVQFNKFVPGVYCVRNKTDSDGTDTYQDSNKFFPSYLCINSPGNIIPYVGYFNEGVFASNTFKTKIEQTPPSYSANVTCTACNGQRITATCTACHGKCFTYDGDELVDCTACSGNGIILDDANCTACDGTGYTSYPTTAQPGLPMTVCTTCNGTGKNYICKTCSGEGYTIDENGNVISCAACEGTGIIETCRCTSCAGKGYYLAKITDDSITGTLYKQWSTIDSSNNADNSDAAMIRYTNWSDKLFKLRDTKNSDTYGYITYYDYKVVNNTEKLVGIDPGTDVTNGLVWQENSATQTGQWVRAQGNDPDAYNESLNSGMPAVDAEFSTNNGISDKNGSRQNITSLLNSITAAATRAEYYGDVDYFRSAYKAMGDVTLGIAYNLPVVNPNEKTDATKKIKNYGYHGLGLQKYVTENGGLYSSDRHSYLNAIQYLDKAIKMGQSGRCAYYISPVVGMNKSDIFNTYVEENVSHSGTFVGFMGGAVGKQCGGVLDNVTVNLNLYNYLKRDTFRTSADNSIENKESVMMLESNISAQPVKSINCVTHFDTTLVKDDAGNILTHKLINVTKDESSTTEAYTGTIVGEVNAQYPAFDFDSGKNSEPISIPTYNGLNINFQNFKNARMYVTKSYYDDLETMKAYSATGLFTIPMDKNTLITDDMSDAVTGNHNLNQGISKLAYVAYNYGDVELNQYSAVDASKIKNVKSAVTEDGSSYDGSTLKIYEMMLPGYDQILAYTSETIEWLYGHRNTMPDYGDYVDIVKYESLFDILSYSVKPDWRVDDDKSKGKRYFKTTTQAWFTPATILEAIRCSYAVDKNDVDGLVVHATRYINSDPTVTEEIVADITDEKGTVHTNVTIYPQVNADGESYVNTILEDSYSPIKLNLDSIGTYKNKVKEKKIFDMTRWGKQYVNGVPYILNVTVKNADNTTATYPITFNAVAINEIVCHEENVQEGQTLTTLYKQSQMVIDRCNGITLQGVACNEDLKERTEVEIFIESLDMSDLNSLNFIDKFSSKVVEPFKRTDDPSDSYSKENITGEKAIVFYDKRRKSALNLNTGYNAGIYKYLNILSDATNFKANSADQVLYYKYFNISNDMVKNYQTTLKSISNVGAIAGSLVVNNKQYINNCNGFLNNYQGTIFERESYNCLPDITGNLDTYTGLYKMVTPSENLSKINGFLDKGYLTQDTNVISRGEIFDENKVPMYGVRYRVQGDRNLDGYNQLEFKGPIIKEVLETSKIYTDSKRVEYLSASKVYKYMGTLYVQVYLKTAAGIKQCLVQIDYPIADVEPVPDPAKDPHQLLLIDREGTTTSKEMICTAESLFKPFNTSWLIDKYIFKDSDNNDVKPEKDTDGKYHIYAPNPANTTNPWTSLPDKTVLEFTTTMTDNWGRTIESNKSYTYLVPEVTTKVSEEKKSTSKLPAMYFSVPICSIDIDESGHIYTTGNLLKMSGGLNIDKDGRYWSTDRIFDLNDNEIDMDAHLPILTNIGGETIQVRNICGSFYIKDTGKEVENVQMKDSKTGEYITDPDVKVKWSRLSLCHIKSLNLPANTGTAEKDRKPRTDAWLDILKKLYYADFTKEIASSTDYELRFKDEEEFNTYVSDGRLQQVKTKIEGTTYDCTYNMFVEYNVDYKGMHYYSADEVQHIYTENPDILNPKYADYNLLNRYGALAAICEYHSSNIGDLTHSSNDPNNILNQMAKRPVIFTNNKFAYREHSGIKGKKFYTMGPMMASKYISNIYSQRAIGHKLYGIASPLIAEIKVVPKSVPSVINFSNGAVPGINETGQWRDGETNQYVGMFTLDQGFRGSIRDPGGRCMNLALDAPAIGNFSCEYNADNIFFNVDYRIIAENLFDWSSTYVDAGNNGIYTVGGDTFYPGYGYSYTQSPIQTITVATNSYKDLIPPKYWPRSIQLFEDLNESKIINGAIDFDWLQAGCDVLKVDNPLYLKDDELNTLFAANKRRNRYAYYGSSLVLVRDDDSNFYGMVNYNHVRDGKFINDCTYSYDHGNTGIQFFNLPAEGKWGLTKGWSVSLATLPDYTKYDNQFVYTYELYERRPAQRFFTKPVKFESINNLQGYWVQNNIATGAEADYPVSALSAASTAYSEYYTPSGEETTKYEPVDEGNLRYRGNLLSIGITKSPAQIRKEISLNYHSWTSAISGTDIQGILVQDSNDNNVMYINMNMGDCYGTETWNMNCKASDDNAISGVSGLLLEIGV